MKTHIKEKLLNYVMLFGLIGFLLAGSFFIWSYFEKRSNDCIANPLVYGAKDLTETYGNEFSGVGGFYSVPNTPLVYFNSTGMYVKNPN